MMQYKTLHQAAKDEYLIKFVAEAAAVAKVGPTAVASLRRFNLIRIKLAAASLPPALRFTEETSLPLSRRLYKTSFFFPFRVGLPHWRKPTSAI